MAARLQWMPDTLQNSAISAIVSSYKLHDKDIRALPNNLLAEVLHKLYRQNMLEELAPELEDLEVILRLLSCKGNRVSLHQMFQGLMDARLNLAKELSDNFAQLVCMSQQKSPFYQEKLISRGLALGSFFCEAGWYDDAEITFSASLQLAKLRTDLKGDEGTRALAMAAECCLRLLVTLNSNCKYDQATEAYDRAFAYFEELDRRHAATTASKGSASTRVACSPVNRAALYGYYCALLFTKSQYDAAYLYGEAALKQLQDNLPAKVVVDVLRHASKACVIKREFARAEMLVRGAVNLAWDEFGKEHPKFADALIDYGFYLLNVDCTSQSVVVYDLALKVRKHCFTTLGSGSNLNVAAVFEDLAYAMYVREYSTGQFQRAQSYAQRSIEIITHILPPDHLLLASSNRVKALILEEVAIDSADKDEQAQKLTEAEELHLRSLDLAMAAFGESNVQTAKHYGNLGRLYQSMQKFDKAEEMHLKAIEIKEQLLGPEDYEVALSVGHLASLYNYDMQLYDKAEQLYFRSIEIGKKLFGDGYSGLEYDYRGLLRLYHSKRDLEKAREFQLKLHDWASLREEQIHASSETSESHRQRTMAMTLSGESASPPESEIVDLNSLKTKFFSCPTRFPKPKSAFNLPKLQQELDHDVELDQTTESA